MVVSNNIVLLALANNSIIRIDLENPAIVDDIEISNKASDRIFKVYLDYTGRHCIVTMVNGDNFYIHGIHIYIYIYIYIYTNTCTHGTTTSTKPVLIGKSKHTYTIYAYTILIYKCIHTNAYIHTSTIYIYIYIYIYITGLSNKAKPLTKMRGHILTSIGFEQPQDTKLEKYL